MKRVLSLIAAMLVYIGFAQAQIVTNGELTNIYDPNIGGLCAVTKFPRYDIGGRLLESPAFGTNQYQASPIGWRAIRGTPDFYLECYKQIPFPVQDDGVRNPGDLPDKTAPVDKGAFLGMWVSKDYREYVQNELQAKLVAGRRYRLTARVAIRENFWGNTQAASNTLALSAPKQISLLLSSNEFPAKISPADPQEAFLQWRADASFQIVDEAGFGTFEVYQLPINGADRWQDITYEFTVPNDMLDGIQYIALAPGPINRAINADDVVALQPGAKDEICYIYIDGVEITEVPCTCNDVEIKYEQFLDLEYCCFKLTIKNPKNCDLKSVMLQSTAPLLNADGAFLDLKSITENLSDVNWLVNDHVIKTYCVLFGNRVVDDKLEYQQVKSTITLGSGVTCDSSFDVSCKPCDCKTGTPRVRLEPTQPLFAAGMCCYRVVVDNPSGCPRAKVVKWRIYFNGSWYESTRAIELNKLFGNVVFSEVCIPSGSKQNVRVELSMSLDKDTCKVSIEEELTCSCCYSATVTATTPTDKELLSWVRGVPNCWSCGPIAIRLNYFGGSLCADSAIIVFPNGLRQTVRVPLTQPTGTSRTLELVCPGNEPYTITVMIGECVYKVTVPACSTKRPDDHTNPFGKGTGNDQDRGEASPYTLSVTDIRGVSYGTYTGTNIDQLFEQSRSSTLPNGFYVVYVRDARGSLIDRRFFIK